MIDYDYYYEQYRHVPRNSTTVYKDLADFQSTASASAYNLWSGQIKRTMTTTYIDGSRLQGINPRPYSMKDSFPKGKGRHKSAIPSEKKINTGDVFMSLLPADRTIPDTATVRSEKTRSTLSLATGTQCSALPDLQRKSSNIRNNRIYSATVFDDENSDAKLYGRHATTHASGAWVRRYKSINESQTLTDLLRNQIHKDKNLLPNRTSQQSFLLSSPSKSSFNSSLTKRRLAQC